MRNKHIFSLLFVCLIGATFPDLILGQNLLGSNQLQNAEKEVVKEEEKDEVKTGPESPEELVKEFFDLTDRYAKNTSDQEALNDAGKLFQLKDVLSGSRSYVGNEAARALANFLNAVPGGKRKQISVSADQSEYAWDISYETNNATNAAATIELVRNSNGIWLFSEQTRKNATKYWNAIADVSTTQLIQDSSTWLQDRVPDWMERHFLVLAYWQWLGLLALIFVGVVASALGRLLTMFLRHWILNKRGVESHSKGWRRSRPFGIVAMAAAWYFGLGYLHLPADAYSILLLSVKLVMMVGATWSVCSLVDYAAEAFSALAKHTDTRIDDVVVPLVQRALKIMVVAVGLVWIADNMDMDIAALLAGLSLGGLALTLAARDTVENFFGTIAILADRPFEVGHWILVDGTEGTVEHVGFRSTRIRTFYNSLITVPNALMTRATVDNMGMREYRRIKETIGITYNTPADKVEAFVEGIRELIRRHPYTRKDYFHVYFHSYGDSSLNILLYLFLKTPDWATELRERHRFLLDILRLAQDLGIEFAFPTRTLFMEQAADQATPGATEDVSGSMRDGRKRARNIVDTYTGKKIPPPVDMSLDPRDEAADGVGEGASE